MMSRAHGSISVTPSAQPTPMRLHASVPPTPNRLDATSRQLERDADQPRNERSNGAGLTHIPPEACQPVGIRFRRPSSITRPLVAPLAARDHNGLASIKSGARALAALYAFGIT